MVFYASLQWSEFVTLHKIMKMNAKNQNIESIRKYHALRAGESNVMQRYQTIQWFGTNAELPLALNVYIVDRVVAGFTRNLRSGRCL